MIKAEILYPDALERIDDVKYFNSPYDYQPIIDVFGQVLLQVDDSDYQGDSRILYKKGDSYGYLIFGWGSCSGCDSLQACESYEEIQELIEFLNKEIKWFESLDSLKKYFEEKDWDLEYSYHEEETKEFIKKVLSYGN